MAPQNSTFIHEIVDATSEVSRYSPILPSLKEHNGSDVDDIKSISSQAIYMQDKENEIPIWICGEPRFISGITTTTTCNDIIQVLINDEVGNDAGIGPSNCNVVVSRDFHDYVITERWRDIEQALPGDTCVLPIWNAWGVARNEVKLKVKINKNRAEPSFTAKAMEGKANEHQGRKMNLISKLIRRILKQGQVIQDHISNYSQNPYTKHRSSKRKSKRLQSTEIFQNYLGGASNNTKQRTKDEYTDDEILIVLKPNDDENFSGINIHQGITESITTQANPSDLNLISEIPSYDLLNATLRLPYPYNFEPYEFASSTPHVSNRMRRSLQFNLIQDEILERTQEIKELLKYKVQLNQHLTKKSNKYRAQNELYRTKAGIDVCIEKVQTKLAVYGEEIIQNEMHLYEIKKKIHHKCVVLENLKRMLSGEDVRRYESIKANMTCINDSASRNKKLYGREEFQFVDNVYEFCDQNKSIIV